MRAAIALRSSSSLCSRCCRLDCIRTCADVVPPRDEPFLPKRQADFDEGESASPAGPPFAPAGLGGSRPGDVIGATAVALDPQSTMIERDPSVNRSLMLRLIAGVRGL